MCTQVLNMKSLTWTGNSKLNIIGQKIKRHWTFYKLQRISFHMISRVPLKYSIVDKCKPISYFEGIYWWNIKIFFWLKTFFVMNGSQKYDLGLHIVLWRFRVRKVSCYCVGCRYHVWGSQTTEFHSTLRIWAPSFF